MAHIIPSSISRTALDSLYAKLSAFDSGWLEGDDGLDIYNKLLHRIHDGIDDNQTSKRRRRQSPLVNAGYAARVAIMTYILEQWIHTVTSVDNTENNNNTCINIVLIGCGIDVLGIWCKYLQDKLPIRIYEFDAWDNCILKQKAMIKSKLLNETYSFETDNNEQTNSSSIISKGQITMDVSGKNQNNTEDDYCLAALDLRQTYKEDHKKTILSHLFHEVEMDEKQPTIVLSELVLAYLGYDGANATMSSIANDILCRGNEYSMFACLEPVLPGSEQETKTINDTTKIQSVEESYSMDYSQQFLGKLQKGNSKYTANTESSWLHPLGDDMKSIQQRLEKCGFSSSNVCYTTLGVATANVAQIRRSYAPNFLRANEPFDEHVALALNLSCYGVVCAFASETETTTIHNAEAHQDWRQKVCPWKSSSYIRIYPITTLFEDNQVRELYGQIYCHLYEEYPAIRKMVKSALKTDFCIKGAYGETSIVRSRFTDKGGSFWVATDNNNSSRIVGCVGVRLRKKTEKEAESISSSPKSTIEYEIQRLAVDNTHRGKGTGRKLLLIAEEYTYKKEEDMKSKRNSDDSFMKLWATTPECLVAANKLYNSSGYEQVGTFQAGSLCMNIYCKTLTYNGPIL
jgi:ribosomal protein S18 acetylase RimI-like enzyme